VQLKIADKSAEKSIEIVIAKCESVAEHMNPQKRREEEHGDAIVLSYIRLRTVE
jgi:hypothetical protein